MDNLDYITGSHGFLGSHLIKVLNKPIKIPHKDITSFNYKPFDNFYFLSTFGNLIHHDDDDKAFQANIIDLIKVLQQVIHYDFKSFVFISTSSVKLRRQTMYSRLKKAAEEILLACMQKYRKPICIVRPLSITGRNEQSVHLIPALIRSCLTGELVNFDPYPAHDFIDVEDVVKGIKILSDCRARGIYELGTGKQYTNQQVLELVEKATGKKANINIVHKLRDYDTTRWVSTNFKARGYGWLPQKSLEQSIKEMCE